MGLLKSIMKNLLATPESIGSQGEKMIAKKLRYINFCGRRGRVLQNVYVPRGNGETTEIDLLYITQKGIFVIESKNYSGFIFGNENSQNWTSTLFAGKDRLGRKQVEKHHFYNPIWQNRIHIKALKHYLGADVQTVSVIVFSERCELKSIYFKSPDVFVCKRNMLTDVVRDIWNSYPDIFSDEQIDSIFEALFPLTNQDESIKEKHISDIQMKINSAETCPLCGSPLAVRTVRQGPDAGHQFLGCSRYPNCRYTRNL